MGRYYIRVHRLLTLLLMAAMAFVSSTSVAAALCGHQDAQQHQAALDSEDVRIAASAELEEAAGALGDKKGTLADAGTFALPLFILPAPSLSPPHAAEKAVPRSEWDTATVRSRALRPLLEPPAA